MYHDICVEVRGQLWESLLSFYSVGPGAQTQVVRFRSRYLYHLTGSSLFYSRLSPTPVNMFKSSSVLAE